MTVAAVDLTLASATLSGGARLASAGSGLPQRLTTEEVYFIDAHAIMGASSQAAQAIAFTNDSDGIVYVGAAHSTRRFSFAGANIWTAASINGRSVWRLAGNTVIVAREVAGATYAWEIDDSTGTMVQRTVPSANYKNLVTVPGGTADRIWASSGSNTLTEIVYSTGVASGRTITLTGSSLNLFASNWDGVPSLYVLESASRITRHRESDLALLDTWTTAAPTNSQGAPGSQWGVHWLYVDSVGRVYVKSESPYALDRLPAVGGTNMHLNTGVERLVWPSVEIGGPTLAPATGGSQQQPGVAISPNGRYVALIVNSAAYFAQRGVLVRNIQDQTVEWTHAVTGGTWNGVEVPGNRGERYGVTGPQWRAGTLQDFRNARAYYQRVGVDGSPVFLTDGLYVPPAGISLAGATALKVGFVFNEGFGKPGGPAPYIGGPSGEGPRLWIDDGAVASTGRRNRLYGSL